MNINHSILYYLFIFFFFFQFLCDPARLSEVKTMLEGRSLTVENFYEQYEPLAPVTPSEAEQKEIDSITEKLENMDSYVEMHTNIEA